MTLEIMSSLSDLLKDSAFFSGENDQVIGGLKTALSEVLKISGSVDEQRTRVEVLERRCQEEREKLTEVLTALVSAEESSLAALRAIIDKEEREVIASLLDGEGVNPEFLDAVYAEYCGMLRERLTAAAGCCEERDQDEVVRELKRVDAKRKLDVRFLREGTKGELLEKLRELSARRPIVSGEITRVFNRARILEVYSDIAPELIAKAALCPITTPLETRKRKRT